MGRRTSVWLADDLDAAVQASGLRLAELIRRGLEHTVPAAPDGYPPVADFARWLRDILTRLDEHAGRIGQLEAFSRGPGDDDDEVTVADLPTLEEIEQRREQRDRLKAAEWHRQLCRHVGPDKHGQRVVTANTAAAALRVGAGAARDRLHMLTSFGLATFLDDGEQPYRWLLSDEEDSTDAATVAP